MAQYTILNSAGEDTIELSDGTSTFRVQVRGTKLFFDVELTATGFSGDENTDWISISESSVTSSIEEFRLGVRNKSWNIDQALSSTSFDGTQDIDWQNIETHSL